LSVLKNFSCVNAGLSKAVMAKNRTCFNQCPDGHKVMPSSTASDCWIECYYRVVSGGLNGELGLPQITREEMVAAWSVGLNTADPAKGGCPALGPAPSPPSPPLTPPSVA
jgi:hypothetical protein